MLKGSEVLRTGPGNHRDPYLIGVKVDARGTTSSNIECSTGLTSQISTHTLKADRSILLFLKSLKTETHAMEVLRRMVNTSK